MPKRQRHAAHYLAGHVADGDVDDSFAPVDVERAEVDRAVGCA